MSKKQRPKDIRKRQEEEKREKYKKQEELRKKQEELRKEQEQRREDQKELEKIKKEVGEEGEKKKSRAKALGLKSTFILDRDEQKVLMTSFGQGNKAVRDKYIIGDKVSDINDDRKNKKAALLVEVCGKSFNISKKENDDCDPVKVNNPVVSRNKKDDDLIHCRKKLEELYFGEQFKDNIHIQLIYNILDIEKILAVQVNNIVFALNNLLSWSGEEKFDLIGYLGVNDTYEKIRDAKGKRKGLYEKFSTLIEKKRMRYFGSTFYPLNEKGEEITSNDKKEWEQFEKKCYHLLAVLGMMRQATAHGDSKRRAEIYKLGKEFDKSEARGCRQEARKELDDLYRKKIHEMNQSFLKNSKRDILMLFRIYDAESKEAKRKLAQEYYEFIMLKSYKNTGFSIKHLRETVIDKMDEDIKEKIKDDKYNPIRRKLYRIMDFVIYQYYQESEQQEEAMELVRKLRNAETKVEKELTYRKEAEKLKEELEKIIRNSILSVCDRILAEMNEKRHKKVNQESSDTDSEEPLDPEISEGITFIKETAHSFSEMIYLLTVFLDGKEINILLTQLIHCFDNISSFMDTMKEENLLTKLKEDYEIFEESKEISKELRIINSFARMTEPVPKTEKTMFIDAAQILGYSNDEKELEGYVDALLDTKNKTKDKKKKGFVRYIWNNVIKSTRFRYLVRYADPKKVRAFAANKKVVAFVLKDIPDEQIKAYYNSCFSQNSDSSSNMSIAFQDGDSNKKGTSVHDMMRKALTEKITGLNFGDFEEESKKGIRREESDKNIIRLYLTVLYLVQKNLIYVNSRYFLAFHCAERDEVLYNGETIDNNKEKGSEKDWKKFAKEFIIEHPPKKKVKDYLAKNFEYSNKWSLRVFRNSVQHLNVIRDAYKYIKCIDDNKDVQSYFALYHYLVQRYISEMAENLTDKGELSEGRLQYYLSQVENYRTYCKDFVKALNVPFAYNLPRYKNLSIDELFDRNNYLPNKAKKWISEKKENGEYVMEDCGNKGAGQVENA